MKTIYRKVMSEEGLPNIDREYFTDAGRVEYFSNHWIDVECHIKWWLEEIELPSEEEIDKMYPERNSSGTYLDTNMGRREGAKWLIEKITKPNN